MKEKNRQINKKKKKKIKNKKLNGNIIHFILFFI